MSDFRRIDGHIGGQAIDSNSDSQQHHLGECISARDMASTDYGVGEFIYAKGLDSTAVGEVVIVDADAWTTKLAVADDVGRIALAMSACVTGEFGWYQTRGKGVALVLASFADNLACYLTSTPGSIDDAVVGGDRIHKMESASAIATPAAGQAEIDLDYPFTDNFDDTA